MRDNFGDFLGWECLKFIFGLLAFLVGIDSFIDQNMVKIMSNNNNYGLFLNVTIIIHETIHV